MYKRCLVALVAIMVNGGCSHSSDYSPTDLTLDSSIDLTPDSSTDLAPDSSADLTPDSSTVNKPCEALFGAPSDKTGLPEGKCKPSCDCDGVDLPPQTYTETEIAALAARTLLNPPDPLTSDPYLTPELYPHQPNKLCGMLVDPKDANAYRLDTYDDLAALKKAGATVTHYGACGLCSSFENLAVYIRIIDLTTPVRSCGMKNIVLPPQNGIACLQKLGFDLPCAQIWYYNTANTRAKCLIECLVGLAMPYHKKDGTPNACIMCDEMKSGPVFKAVAGRTRRNSGLPTALCRPCSTVSPVVHSYP